MISRADAVEATRIFRVKRVRVKDFQVLDAKPQKYVLTKDAKPEKASKFDSEYYNYCEPASHEAEMHIGNYHSNISKYGSRNHLGRQAVTLELGDKNPVKSKVEEYNSGTLIIHSDQDAGTMRIQASNSREDLSGSKSRYAHSQYQQYVEFMKDADHVLENRELLSEKNKLSQDIGELTRKTRKRTGV